MRTKTGARQASGCILSCLLLASLLGAGPRQAVEPAVIAGTVFQEPGFALPRAEITLTATSPPEGVKSPKPQKTVTNGRGEYFFRVPPFKAEYRLTARAPGFIAEQRPAAISGGPERVEIYITLKLELQKGKEK